MPAKDFYHDCVKVALVKDGWTITHDPQLLYGHDGYGNDLVKDGWPITHDPLSLKVGKKDIFIDLAAEKLLVAEKPGQKIAVEVKSFIGASEIEDLKNALGQYILYEKILRRFDAERILYLAIRDTAFNKLFTEEIGKILLEDKSLKMIVFDPDREVITQWIN